MLPHRLSLLTCLAMPAACRYVLLDAGPLGTVTHPRANKNKDITEWLQQLLRAGVAMRVPEISDYEIRRELVRTAKSKGIQRLDDTDARGAEAEDDIR